MNQRKWFVRLVTVAMLVAIVLSGGYVANQQRQSAEAAPSRQDTPRSITVTGFGVAYATPDIAYMSLGVESANTDIRTAVSDTTSRMEAVLAALREAGIAPEDIRTEYYNIYQEYGGPVPMGSADEQPQRTYRVTNVVNVTVRDVTKVADILAAAVDAGANVVNNISFDIASRSSLEADARASALDDARSRAEQLASLLGVSLGEVLAVREGSEGFFGPVAAQQGLGGGGGAPPISGGTLSISVNLTVTFAIS